MNIISFKNSYIDIFVRFNFTRLEEHRGPSSVPVHAPHRPVRQTFSVASYSSSCRHHHRCLRLIQLLRTKNLSTHGNILTKPAFSLVRRARITVWLDDMMVAGLRPSFGRFPFGFIFCVAAFPAPLHRRSCLMVPSQNNNINKKC